MITSRRRRLPDIEMMCGPGELRSFNVPRFGGAETLTGIQTGRLVLADAAKGTQYTESESHPGWRTTRKGKFSGDVGGPFFTQKRLMQAENPSAQYATGTFEPISGPYLRSKYRGPVLAVSPQASLIPSSLHSSKAALITKGATAIARCKPTNSLANVAVTLAELYREGLPKLFGSALWKKKSALGREIGDEYLNTQFGWQPMISDIIDISRGVAFAKQALELLERGSGSIVRRRYEFPDVTTGKTAETLYVEDPVGFPGLGQCLTSDGARTPVYRDTETSVKTWFSGAFTYYMPSGYKSHNALIRLGAKADALLGVNITPEVLWNLTPWSWAVDWFSNAGDVISNLSDWATDGLVLKYGYLMEHSFISYRYYKIDNRRLRPENRYVYPSPVVASVETKQRIEATPFGFGLNFSSFTGRQLSIVAALGLARS